jgi:hypothetical protein
VRTIERMPLGAARVSSPSEDKAPCPESEVARRATSDGAGLGSRGSKSAVTSAARHFSPEFPSLPSRWCLLLDSGNSGRDSGRAKVPAEALFSGASCNSWISWIAGRTSIVLDVNFCPSFPVEFRRVLDHSLSRCTDSLRSQRLGGPVRFAQLAFLDSLSDPCR